MNRDLERLQELFEGARELSPPERSDFLDRHAADSPEVRAKVSRLLRHYDARAQPLEQPIAVQLEESRASSDLASEPLPIDPTLQLAAGTSIANFKVIKALGAGGMGVVYLAEQPEPKRQVALKIIRPELASEELLHRFRFEATVLAQLQHTGIAHIYDSGFAEIQTALGKRSLPYIAMEWVNGPNIVRHCEDLDVRDTLHLFCKVCDAVEQAHRSGFIHCDLKPGNILVQRDGHPRVLDFGVAREITPELQRTLLRTQIGQLVGSIAFMSPEQISGDPSLIDQRSDIYALGVILYRLLAGRHPLELENKPLAEVSRIIAEENPTDLSAVRMRYRGDISTIVNKALAKEPAQRYSTVQELADDLRRHLTDQPITAHPPSSWYRLTKFSRRHRGMVTGVSIALLVLLIGSLTSTMLAVRNSHLATLAQQSEKTAQYTTYRTSILASVAALKNRDYKMVSGYLEAAPENLRDWEWHYLDSLARGDAQIYDTSGYSPAVFDPAGIPLAALFREGSVEVVELDRNVTRTRLPIEKRGLEYRITEDGRRLIIDDHEDDRLEAWDLETAEQLWSVSVDRNKEPARLRPQVTTNADGSLIALDLGPVIDGKTGQVLRNLNAFAAAIHGHEILEWDYREQPSSSAPWFRRLNARTGESSEVFRLETRGANGIAWAPDGSRFAMRDTFGVTRILDSEHRTISTLRSNNARPQVPMRLTHSDTLWESGPSFEVRRLALKTGEQDLTLPTQIPVEEIAVSSDETALAITSKDAVEYRTLPQESQILEGHTNFVYSVAFSPDGTLLVSGGWDNTTRLWDVVTGEEIASIHFSGEQLTTGDGKNRGASFSPDGDSVLIVSNEAENFYRWRPATGDCSLEWARVGEADLASMTAALFEQCAPNAKFWIGLTGERFTQSNDRRFWAEGAWKEESRGVVRVWPASLEHETLGTPLHEFAAHEGGVTGVAFDRSGTLLATSGRADQQIRLWDWRTAELKHELVDTTLPIFSLSFHPEGRRLASGGRDGRLKLWDLETGEMIASLKGHKSYIHSVVFSPDGTRIATASGDGTVRIWDSISRSVRLEEAARAASLRTQVAPYVEQALQEFGAELGAKKLRDHFRNSPERWRAAMQVQVRLLRDE